MKNKIKYVVVVIFISAIISGGLIYAFRKSIIAEYLPEIEQIGDIHIKVENDTCYVSSKLSVRNKSFLKIGVDTIKYKVSLFNKTYLQNQKFIGIEMPGHAKDTVDFSVKIPYITIIKDLKAERKKGDSTSYIINISLQYSTFLGKAEMPINKSAKLKIPQPPEIEITDINYKRVRMKSILANIKIKITNYNAFTLSVKHMNYNMNIISQGNLKGSHTEDINIKPNGATFIDLPVEISPKNLAKTVFDIIINKDSYDYALSLNATIESTTPVKDSFPIVLTKIGKMELRK